MKFSLGRLGPWKKRAIDQLTLQRREIILRLFRAVVMDTPVLEGTLRGNWQCSSLSPKTGTISKRSADEVVREIQKVLEGSKLDTVIYLRNNLPYAAVVEYGLYPNPPKNPTGKTVDGFSKKAPQGMVRKNVMRFHRIVAAVKENRR